MMARDSTPQQTTLSAASLGALQTALQTYLSESDPKALQPVLHRVANEARERQMHAEHLLVALKDVWFALPPIAHTTPTDLQNRLLQRAVTLCIQEYYST